LVEAFAVVREAARADHRTAHYDVHSWAARRCTSDGSRDEKLVRARPLSPHWRLPQRARGMGVHSSRSTNTSPDATRSGWGGSIASWPVLWTVVADINDFDAKRAAYDADITYGTNTESFRYLRDNMAVDLEQMVQRATISIVDEVDSILIDEARTPSSSPGPQ